MNDTKTKIYNLNQLSDSDIGIIDRQWIRANYVKEHYERTLKNTNKDILGDVRKFYISEAGTFMWLWYSLLFSVMERLREKHAELEHNDKDFDALFKSMKLARNSIFHAENRYWDNRQIKLMEIQDAGSKIRRLHDGIGYMLLEKMNKEISNKKL